MKVHVERRRAADPNLDWIVDLGAKIVAIISCGILGILFLMALTGGFW